MELVFIPAATNQQFSPVFLNIMETLWSLRPAPSKDGDRWVLKVSSYPKLRIDKKLGMRAATKKQDCK